MDTVSPGKPLSMSEYVRTMMVGVDTRSVWDSLADPREIAAYGTALVSVEPTDRAEWLRVVTEVGGARRPHTVRLRRHRDAGTLRWYSPGSYGHEGQLAVTALGLESAVTVILRTNQAYDPRVSRALHHALTRFKQHTESRYTDESDIAPSVAG